jgi:5'-deoxynucleotidase
MNNNSPFPPELRTMSIVPRWSIVWTTQEDNVANHSFYVTVYSHMIARTIKWKGPKDYLMFLALMHDADETITGDVVSPAKDQIVDYDKMADYVDAKMYERMGGLVHELAEMGNSISTKVGEEADAIVKAADRMDALFFLLVEARRGNNVIDSLILKAQLRLESAWRELPAEETVLDFKWNTVVLPAIERHKVEGGLGI